MIGMVSTVTSVDDQLDLVDVDPAAAQTVTSSASGEPAPVVVSPGPAVSSAVT
jgi:hypothetical protein